MASSKELKALITLAGKVDPSLQSALLKAQKGTADTTMKLSKLEQVGVKALNATRKAAKATAVGLAALAVSGGVALWQLGKEGIETASNLAEVQNVVDVTFADSAKEIDAWSSNLLNSYVFDTVSKTLQSISTAPADGCSCCAVGGKIYTIGGRTTSREVWSLDTTKLTWEKKKATVPNSYTELTPSVAFGNKVYLFGNSNSSSTTSRKVTIYDTETDTFTETGKSINGGVNATCFGSDGLNVYFIGGIGEYGSNSKQLQKFSFETTLTGNHLFLQEDYGYDGLWTALKSKDTDFKVKVINAYLGDSSNIAQLTNAYLYDSKDLKWKSLSGESYVADMQKALNILGVN